MERGAALPYPQYIGFYSCAQVARELGIRDNLLTRWKREAQNPEAAAFGGAGQKAPLTLSDIWSIRRAYSLQEVLVT